MPSITLHLPTQAPAHGLAQAIRAAGLVIRLLPSGQYEARPAADWQALDVAATPPMPTARPAPINRPADPAARIRAARSQTCPN